MAGDRSAPQQQKPPTMGGFFGRYLGWKEGRRQLLVAGVAVWLVKNSEMSILESRSFSGASSR